MRKIFFLLFFVLNICLVYSTNININTELNNNFTIINYHINFSNSSKYTTFSLEKPKDSIIISAMDGKNQSLFYSIAGDFYIFKLNSVKIKDYNIKLKSNIISNDCSQNGIFKMYVNFNFPVDNLTFNLFLLNDFGEISEVFPKKYSLLDNKEIIWRTNNFNKEVLFMVNFKKDPKNFEEYKTNNKKDNQYENMNFNDYIVKNIYLIISLFVFIILVLIYLYKKLLRDLIRFNLEYFKFNKNNNLNNNDNGNNNNSNDNVNSNNIINSNNIDNNSNNVSNNKINKNIIINSVKDNIKNNINNNSDDNINNINNIDDNNLSNKTIAFEEFLDKYLTKNEREVVQIVFNNEGLPQNEILNMITGMKKSNLSKIITKLDGKRILKRIRVGKINKIYIGEKLEVYRENNDLNKNMN